MIVMIVIVINHNFVMRSDLSASIPLIASGNVPASPTVYLLGGLTFNIMPMILRRRKTILHKFRIVHESAQYSTNDVCRPFCKHLSVQLTLFCKAETAHPAPRSSHPTRLYHPSIAIPWQEAVQKAVLVLSDCTVVDLHQRTRTAHG